MKKLLYRFLFRASEALGTYEPFEVGSEEEMQACLTVLDRVRREELNRVVGSSVVASSAFADQSVEDRFFGVRHARTGEVVGCLRGLEAEQVAGVPDSRLEYGLDRIPPALLAKAAIGTRLAVVPEHRRSSAGMQLFVHFFEEGLRGGYELCLLACEPGLYSMYVQLGFRPLGACHASPSGGFRIPMVMVVHDVDHLRAVGSPLLAVAERAGAVGGNSPGVKWYRSLIASGEAIDPGVQAYRPAADEAGEEEAVHAALTAGMSEAGVQSLLRNALVVPCTFGQLVLRASDGGRQVGLVMDGLLEVVVDDRVVTMLGPGEVFGEMAFVLDGRRSADVRAAAPDTKVVLLSQRSIDRLTDPVDSAALWRNLARLLAHRLQATTRRLAGNAGNAGQAAPPSGT